MWFGGQRAFGLTHNRTGVNPGILPISGCAAEALPTSPSRIPQRRALSCSALASRVPVEGRTFARYLPSALHDLCGRPIPAPLKCHSVGRGTSVPTFTSFTAVTGIRFLQRFVVTALSRVRFAILSVEGRPGLATQPLCDFNPFDSIFLILRRVGVVTSATRLPEFPLVGFKRWQGRFRTR